MSGEIASQPQEESKDSFINAPGTAKHFIAEALRDKDPAIMGIRLQNEKWKEISDTPIPTIHIAIPFEHERKPMLKRLGLNEDTTPNKRINVPDCGNGINTPYSYLRVPAEVITSVVEEKVAYDTIQAQKRAQIARQAIDLLPASAIERDDKTGAFPPTSGYSQKQSPSSVQNLLTQGEIVKPAEDDPKSLAWIGYAERNKIAQPLVGEEEAKSAFHAALNANNISVRADSLKTYINEKGGAMMVGAIFTKGDQLVTLRQAVKKAGITRGSQRDIKDHETLVRVSIPVSDIGKLESVAKEAGNGTRTRTSP